MSRSASLDEARAVKAKVAEIFARMTDVVGVGVTRIDGGYGVEVVGSIRKR